MLAACPRLTLLLLLVCTMLLLVLATCTIPLLVLATCTILLLACTRLLTACPILTACPRLEELLVFFGGTGGADVSLEPADPVETIESLLLWVGDDLLLLSVRRGRETRLVLRPKLLYREPSTCSGIALQQHGDCVVVARH